MASGPDAVLRCGLRLVVCVAVLGTVVVGAFRASRLSDRDLLKALMIKRPGGSHQVSHRNTSISMHCIFGNLLCLNLLAAT